MYRKTHPQTFLISIWVCICLVSPFIKSDLLTPAIIFLIDIDKIFTILSSPKNKIT